MIGTHETRRSHRGTQLGILLTGLALLFASRSAATGSRQASPSCTPPPAVSMVDGLTGDGAEISVVDLSGSTNASALHAEYRQGVTDVVTRARADSAVFMLETFTASSSSANVAFAASFKGNTGDAVFDLGAGNRVACQAGIVIDRVLGQTHGHAHTTGSDPAGALAAAVSLAQPFVRAHQPVTITLLTDGWIAPAATGPNRGLLNLQAAIVHGESPSKIISSNRDQLLVTNAQGIDIVVRGLDHEGNAELGNTVEAYRLTAFYDALCHALDAHSCDVSSDF